MPLENNKEGIKNTNANTKKQRKDLDRLARQENDIKRKNGLDDQPSFHEHALKDPDYIEIRDKADTHKVLEPVRREDQLMNGSFASISERLNPSLGKALQAQWEAQKREIKRIPNEHPEIQLEDLKKALQEIQKASEPKDIPKTPETEKMQELASQLGTIFRLKKAYQTEQTIHSALDEELRLQLSKSPEDSDIRKDALTMTKNKEMQKKLLKELRDRLDEMKGNKPYLREIRKSVKIVLKCCEMTNISLEKQKFLLKLDKWINHENFDPKNQNQAIQRTQAIIDKLCEESIWDHLDRGGGKAELAEAKIICLGEHHEAPIHRIYQKVIFNSLAKDGDIVLLEGIESSQSAPISSAKEHIGQSTKSIEIFGWDNMDAHMAQTQITINAMNSGLSSGHHLLDALMTSARDKKLKETISKMRQDHPDKKIFVIGGINHFTRYAKMISEAYSKEAIILTPTNEPSAEEIYKRRVIKYPVKNSPVTDKMNNTGSNATD